MEPGNETLLAALASAQAETTETAAVQALMHRYARVRERVCVYMCVRESECV